MAHIKEEFMLDGLYNKVCLAKWVLCTLSVRWQTSKNSMGLYLWP